MSQQKQAVQIQQDQQSEWSLSSLQELKGLNLNQLKQQQDIQQPRKQKQPQFNDNFNNDNKNKLQPKYPPIQQINLHTKLYEVGKILQKVGQLLIIQANNYINLVDLDNWLFDSNRECVGFVIDIFGKVQNPYYAIKMIGQYQKKINQNLGGIIGIDLFYAEGCKTLTQQDIRSIKQKSSMHKQADQQNNSSSESDNQDNDQDCRSNTMMKQRQFPRRRRASFQEQPNRDRTRQKRHQPRRIQMQNNNDRRRHFDSRQQQFQTRNTGRDRQHNQIYLQNMYNMYYNQMMQLYNGQNGMPLPKPPVFPMFQHNPQQMQQQPQTSIFFPQQSQMPPPSNYPNFPQFPPKFEDPHKSQ